MSLAIGPCPCGRTDARGRAAVYAECCGPILDGDQPAPDAERLMRSRYTAFVLSRVEHLLASWHTSTRPAELSLEAGVKWLGLEIKSRRDLEDNRAEVCFVARSRVAGRGQRLSERSRFVREEGRWYYLDGDIL